ncbi:MAG: hypothetical protein IPF64_16305 [Flavobacteriales bacterium]|nr:hypothetical protein [Flavobacteriales bacterium]
MSIDALSIDFESFQQEGFLSATPVCSAFRRTSRWWNTSSTSSSSPPWKVAAVRPRRIGSKRGEELLNRARMNGDTIDRALFDDLLETLEIGSLCALGGGLPLGIKNALQYFDEELKGYFKA